MQKITYQNSFDINIDFVGNIPQLIDESDENKWNHVANLYKGASNVI